MRALICGAAWIACVLFLPAVNAADAPAPTLADVSYGSHARQKLDFYRAASDQPTPLLFFIHGGGWQNGDKGTFNNSSKYLSAGISVVSINYRLLSDAVADGVEPPVTWPLADAARALQFVRTRRAEWNLDTSLIGASGSSAGACSALWLAFHDDLADAGSADPVARESTRLYCAGVVRAQTSLDPKQMRAWIPNISYGAHAFAFAGDSRAGVSPFEEFLAARDKIEPWIRQYSPNALVTPDDPDVGLYYDEPPAMGREQQSPAHSANFGVGLAEKLKQEGVEYELVYPGAPDVRHARVEDYLIAKLREAKR